LEFSHTLWKTFLGIPFVIRNAKNSFMRFEYMIIAPSIIWVIWASVSFGESFAWELAQKRADVKVAIGENKLHAIEMATSEIEVYRITQLLTIEGMGKKTLIKLSKILGTRFGYRDIMQNCYKNKIC
jgi:hypothetical protein